MFYRHEILEVNNEKVLYLYITNTYEFAKNLESAIEREENIKSRVQNYIKNRNIDFKGNKIYLVVDGIIVGSLSLSENTRYQEIIRNYVPDYEKIKKEEIKAEEKYFINLEQEDGTIKKISLRNYLLGTLASCILPTFHIESIKAQAILCRTYAFKKMIEEKKVKVKNSCQIYHNINYYKLIWGKNYYEYINKLERGIDETNGQFLTYQNEIVEPIYHTVSNGRTENVEDKGYLNSVSSIWDMDCPLYTNTIRKTLEEVAKRLDIPKQDIKEIRIEELTNTNRVKKVKIGSKTFSGEEIKNLLGLPSSDISFVIEKDSMRFITRGIGNGYGLSQYGANGMAKSGYHYIQILYHYYPNTKLYKVVQNN